jgi:spoIIIJ-associated protein
VIELKEFVGETVEAAAERAAAHFGVPRSRLRVQVLSSKLDIRGLAGASMILASRGAEPTQANLGPVGEFAAGLLERMRVPGRSSVEESKEEGTIVLTLRGEGVSELARRNDFFLPSFTHIVERAAAGSEGEEARVRVELGFDDPAEVRLESLARARAEEVVRTGTPASLDPMNSRQRWIVHNALRNIPGVRSESMGDGRLKRVKIVPA